ncbi:hypothetical protein BC828DRAFT_391916, partial [Blastocladiella britannica]
MRSSTTPRWSRSWWRFPHKSPHATLTRRWFAACTARSCALSKNWPLRPPPRNDSIFSLHLSTGLVELLSKSIQDLNMLDDMHYKRTIPLMHTIKAYLESGVDADPLWGMRDKVASWYDEVEDLETILQDVAYDPCGPKIARKLAVVVEDLFGEVRDDGSDEEN